MARYIDADKLVERYETAINDKWNKKTAPSSWADAYDPDYYCADGERSENGT